MTIEQRIFRTVSKITEHELSDLNADMFLESDLGMDSIKTIDLLNQLINEIPEAQRHAFDEKLSSGEFLSIKTLGELIQVVKESKKQPISENQTDITSPKPSASDYAASGTRVEIIHSQYLFLMAHWATSCCSLNSHLRIQGNLQINIAQQVWQTLLERHPLLRAHFIIPPHTSTFKDYQLEILTNPTAPQIALTDLRHLEKADKEAFLIEQRHHYQNYEWSLEQWPLHRFYLYQLDDQNFELLFSNHHLISDGLGNQQVMREFMVLYHAIETGDVADLPPAISVSDYNTLVEKINNWHDPEQEKQLNEFLNSQGKQSFFWDPIKTGQPKQPFAKNRSYLFTVDESTTETLLRATRDWRLSMNTLLIGAYLRTIAQFAEITTPIILNIPTSGQVYPDADATHLVGCFALNLALSFAVPSGTWQEQLKQINKEIQQAIAGGYDRSQIIQAATASHKLRLEEGKIVEPIASLIRNSVKSNVYMPYTGQTHIQRHYGSVEVIDYHAITSTNAGTLDTLIEIFAGRLNITANYDGNYFSETFIAQFAEAFTQHLDDLAKQVVPVKRVTSTSQKIIASVDNLLLKVAGDVTFRQLTAANMVKDLEADLGLDSLERIRIVTRLLPQLKKDIDPETLLDCRSLREMADVFNAKTETASPSVEIQASQPETLRQATWAEQPIPYLQIIEQCHLTPEATAVLTDDGVSLSYSELHNRSNQLAHYLRSQQIGVGSLVGVMLQRNANLLIAILGILKAGGAYVPLDHNYPVNRLSYMLKHAQIGILLTEQTLQEQLNQLITSELSLHTVLLLDQIQATISFPSVQVFGCELLNRYPTDELECINSPDDLMVVFYTSGTTGVPKGVALAHRGYMNAFKWSQAWFSIQPGERVAQKTSICFDISLLELLWPLMLGATVCTVSTQLVKNPWKLAQWMEEFYINIMLFVPSVFGEFIAAIDFQKHRFPNLRWLFFIGEALPVSFIQQWIDHLGNKVGLANLYGPTEASIHVTVYNIKSRPEQERIPIGHAMEQVYLVVLDDKMNQLSPGNVGELWIGGIQLAQGYLHDPNRTQESFFPNPFPDKIPGKYLYRTGDLVVQSDDGCFDYRGRIDTQIKIRGFRVELGEIESALMDQTNVNEAVALAIKQGEEGQMRLWAWLSGEESDDQTLRAALSGRLPEYMIPHRFSWLPSLPKNPNGKLDRKQLKQWSESGQTPQPAVVKPACYPLGAAQKWLVHFFEPPFQWAGYSRFRYLQPLNRDVFQQALSQIMQRHPALCAVFHNNGGNWQQEFVDPQTPIPVEYTDGSRLSKEQREAKIQHQITETSRHFRIDRWPLWQIFILAETDACYDITIVGHHLINDLVGGGALFKEIWPIYDQLSQGQAVDLGPAPPSFKDYLDYLNQLGQTTQAQYLKYWKSQFPSREYAFHIPIDHRQGANSEASAASESFSLNKEKTLALQHAKQTYDCSLYMLFLAPLYCLMSNWSQQSWVVLSHRTHGRDLGNGHRYFSTVGNFAVNYPVGISVSDESWSKIINQLKTTFAEIPLNGVSFDWIGEQLPSYSYPDNNLTPVRVNYLGNRSFPTSNLFDFSASGLDQRYSLPEQERISLIEVILLIVDGQIKIEWSYSRHFHRAETIRQLGERYLEMLQMLVSEQAPKTALTEITTKQPIIKPVPAKTAIDTYKPLIGKTAIVTGASRGIGRVIALQLSKQGAQLVLVSRSKEALDRTLAEIRQTGGEAIAIQADICHLHQVEMMVEQAIHSYGSVDILINNAGLTWLAPLVDSDPQQWRQIIEVNLFGAYYCCRSVLPSMIKQRSGKIVNIGSDSSTIGYPRFSAYAASKHALLGMTKSLGEEVKKHNIQVNAVCPASVENKTAPNTSAITAEKIASVVSFLASPQADCITGEHINVFGQQDMYSTTIEFSTTD